MGKFHVELGGFAGFSSLEEARAFAHAVEELLNARSDSNNTVVKIRDMAEQVNVSVEPLTYNKSKVFVGWQRCNARMNQLASHAKKYTTVVSGVDWSKHILTCVDNHYDVDEELYVQTCEKFLNDGVSLEEFVANIPEEKTVTPN